MFYNGRVRVPVRRWISFVRLCFFDPLYGGFVSGGMRVVHLCVIAALASLATSSSGIGGFIKFGLNIGFSTGHQYPCFVKVAFHNYFLPPPPLH